MKFLRLHWSDWAGETRLSAAAAGTGVTVHIALQGRQCRKQEQDPSFFLSSASGHIYTAERSAAQRFWSCLWAVVVLVSQQEYSVCLEYYSNIPTGFAPLSLAPRWLDECKVSSPFPSVELCSAVCSHLILEEFKKLIVTFMKDFTSILICDFWSVESYLF